MIDKGYIRIEGVLSIPNIEMKRKYINMKKVMLKLAQALELIGRMEFFRAHEWNSIDSFIPRGTAAAYSSQCPSRPREEGLVVSACGEPRQFADKAMNIKDTFIKAPCNK